MTSILGVSAHFTVTV